MKKIKNSLLLAVTGSLFFVACSSDDDFTPTPVEPEAYENGILISNEGPFGNGTGTITFISDDFSVVEQDIYKKVNGSELGNIVNSMGFTDESAYIVVNNSHRVMIADRYSFEKTDSIVSGLENPRHFASNGSTRGYITAWGDSMDENDDYVAVIDLTTNTISTTIPVELGPEKILHHGSNMYVAHEGAWGQNNLISVISGTSVTKTITVGDIPNSMVVVGDHLYVLGGGNPDYSGNESAGSITKIDLTSNEVIETFTFEETEHPSELVTDGVNLYYTLNGSVYKTGLSSISLPGEPIIDGFFYRLEINNGLLYATDAKDYVSNGSLYVYDLTSYTKISEVATGLIPGGIYFND